MFLWNNAFSMNNATDNRESNYLTVTGKILSQNDISTVVLHIPITGEGWLSSNRSLYFQRSSSSIWGEDSKDATF